MRKEAAHPRRRVPCPQENLTGRLRPLASEGVAGFPIARAGHDFTVGRVGLGRCHMAIQIDQLAHTAQGVAQEVFPAGGVGRALDWAIRPRPLR